MWIRKARSLALDVIILTVVLEIHQGVFCVYGTRTGTASTSTRDLIFRMALEVEPLSTLLTKDIRCIQDRKWNLTKGCNIYMALEHGQLGREML